MKRTLRLGVAAFLAFAGILFLPGTASAHPLGNFTVNLYSGLVVTPGKLSVSYVLDMAEIPTQQEMPSIDSTGDGTADPGERSAWARREAPKLLAGLSASADGSAVRLRVASTSMRFRPGQAGLPILRFEATFTGNLPNAARLSYRDDNFSDRIGWREITAVGVNGEVVRGSSVPARSVSSALLRYPKALLSSPLRVTSATFSVRPGASGQAQAGTITGEGPSSDRPGVTGGGFARLATWSGLSIPVLFVALLLAALFGAVHALLPGHGKTIMAAYLVGAGGRVRQAAAVGVAVAFMHTASVLLIGLVVLSAEHLFAPERVYPWLSLGSGAVIVALGTGLLAMRFRARRIHAFVHGESASHGEAHHHGHTHALDADRPLSRKSLGALAISGGVLPSPTALVVLLSTVAAHRVAFGLGLIVAFSVGLAAALVAVGIVALRVREFVSRRIGTGLARLVPVLSAAVIVGVGLFLVARGATQL